LIARASSTALGVSEWMHTQSARIGISLPERENATPSETTRATRRAASAGSTGACRRVIRSVPSSS
jgi:hypothetical protein